MSLFYQPLLQEAVHWLDAEESRHAIQVLRMRAGDTLELTDGKGFFYEAIVDKPDPKKCTFNIVSKRQTTRHPFYIHIAIAPTKNADRIEWFVEKAVEIGIDEITFLHCKNSERKIINLERVHKVAISAMKQSQQAWLPTINAMVPFKSIMSNDSSNKYIAYVDAQNPVHLKNIAKPAERYLVLIGPEGDFSTEELELASSNGFLKVSLGANRLRTETAGVVSCEILNLLQP